MRLVNLKIVEFWEYCFNKRTEHYILNIRVFLSMSMLCVILGEDSPLWRVSSQSRTLDLNV